MHFLIATLPARGHVSPCLPLAESLVRRGHQVSWLCNSTYESEISATGATFVQALHTPSLEDLPVVPDGGTSGLGEAVSILRRLFVDRIEGQVRDYERFSYRDAAGEAVTFDSFVAADIPPPPALKPPTRSDDGSAFAIPIDAQIVCLCSLGAHTFRALHPSVLYATLGINPLVTFDPEIPPWGSGEQPPVTFLGRWWNTVRHLMGIYLFMPLMTDELNTVRAKLDLPALPRWGAGGVFDGATRSAVLHIMPTTGFFEYPRANMDPAVRFIGPLVPGIPRGWTEPEWWGEMVAKRKAGRKVVHITQGTIRTEAAHLIVPALRALKRMKCNVFVVVGGYRVEDEGEETAVPHILTTGQNIKITAFIPHAALLPHTDLMITNAGYGGVLAALKYGVPLICAGKGEDKPEVAARVAWCGAGIDLGTDKPGEAALKGAIAKVLGEERYRRAAERVMEDFAGHDAGKEAAELLESMVRAERDHGEED